MSGAHRLLGIGLSISCALTAGFAQPPPADPLQFRRFSPRDGLPAAAVHRVLQDSRGFLWLGTYDGLVRYDGAEFRACRHEAGDPDSVADSRVPGVKASNDEGLWSGAGASLGLFILPRWWRNLWFWAGLALVLTVGMVTAGWTVASRRARVRLREAQREQQLALERHRAAEALRESENRYQELLQHTSDGITIAQDGTLKTLNARFAQMCGYPLAEVIGKPLMGFLHPEDRALVVQRHRERLHGEGGLPSAYRFRVLRRDGTSLWVELNTTVVQWNGTPATLNILRDVSERQQAEQILRESEEKYRALFESAGDAILLTRVTPEGPRFMDWNEKALSLFRATPERMAALTPADLSPERQLDGRLSALTIQENLQRVLQGETVICDWVHRRSDGTDFPCEIALRRIDVGGEILIQGIVRDLTERKRAEEERLKLERQMLQVAKLESLGVLAGGIAHDFNNLLTAILGHTDLALQELPRSSPARDNLREVRDSSLRAAELCRQMLAYSGRGRFVIEDLDLTELVETMVKLLMSSTSKKATLDLQLERNLPPVRGDATQIRQVLMNLVINASEALEDRSGTIGISTGSMDCSAEYLEEARVEGTLPAGRYVWMEVTDTGCGMDAATLSRMFEPFFTTKFTGRGLGLSALLGIVRGHRAGLRVRSRPGQGTTFRVLFPAADPSHRASAPAPEGSRAWKGSGTVLLVEDEEPVRAVARRMLERLGFQVLTAVNGREGVEIFRKRSTDIRLVLLDLTMPELDGEETYRELSRIDPAVRAILASGYSRTESASRPGAPGLAGFIQKPYTLGALEKTLRAVLEAAASNPRSG